MTFDERDRAAEQALDAWQALTRRERAGAIGTLAWTDPKALLAACADAKASTFIDHDSDDDE